MLARYSHPTTDESLADPRLPLKREAFPGTPRPFSKSSNQPSICQITSIQCGEILHDLRLGNSLPKERGDMLNWNSGATKNRFSTQNIGRGYDTTPSPAICSQILSHFL